MHFVQSLVGIVGDLSNPCDWQNQIGTLIADISNSRTHRVPYEYIWLLAEVQYQLFGLFLQQVGGYPFPGQFRR